MEMVVATLQCSRLDRDRFSLTYCYRRPVARGDYTAAQTASKSALQLNRLAIIIGTIILVFVSGPYWPELTLMDYPTDRYRNKQ